MVDYQPLDRRPPVSITLITRTTLQHSHLDIMAATKKQTTTPQKSPTAKKTPSAASAAPSPAPRKAPARGAKKAAQKTSSKTVDAKKAPTSRTTAAAASPKPAKLTKKAASLVKEVVDPLAPEERARLKKLLACQATLQTDPTWNQFLKDQEEELHRLRDEILPNMAEVTRSTLRSGESNAASASGQHIADAGSDAEVRDITLRLLDKDRETVYEIDAALERIRLGTYGICEMSLEPIPRGRLQVRPYCRLTVACQQEYEKTHGTAARFRSQNSRLIGYAGTQNDIDPTVSLDETEE